MGGDVDARIRDLLRMQVAHVATHALDGVPAWRHAAYLLAWPGLDAAAFLGGMRKLRPRTSEWARALRNLLVGVALFFGVARFVAPYNLYAAGWVGMAGIVLVLHFGLVPVAVVRLAPCRRRGAAAHEQAGGLRQPRRVLGPPMEHRVPRSDPPVSLSSVDPAAWRAAGHRRRVPLQRAGARAGDLGAGRRRLRRADVVLRAFKASASSSSEAGPAAGSAWAGSARLALRDARPRGPGAVAVSCPLRAGNRGSLHGEAGRHLNGRSGGHGTRGKEFGARTGPRAHSLKCFWSSPGLVPSCLSFSCSPVTQRSPDC